MPIGRRSIGGQSSVKKIATPSPMGTAMSIAIKDVIRVPTIGARAPKFSVTGFHASVTKKLRPKV